MYLIEVERHPNGPRVRITKQRVHHGTVGILIGVTGIMLAWHDRHDWRDWFRPGSQPS
jgi:hypothetical protein